MVTIPPGLAALGLIVFFALVGILLAALRGCHRFRDAARGVADATPTPSPEAEQRPIEQPRTPERSSQETVGRLTIDAGPAALPTEALLAAIGRKPPVTPDAHEATFLRALEAAEYYEEPREPIVRAYTDYIVARVRRDADAESDLRRCQAVDGGGDRCPRPAATMIRYVGQRGFAAADVALCARHAITGVLHPGANP